jgi:hypothetical protein
MNAQLTSVQIREIVDFEEELAGQRDSNHSAQQLPSLRGCPWETITTNSSALKELHPRHHPDTAPSELFAESPRQCNGSPRHEHAPSVQPNAAVIRRGHGLIRNLEVTNCDRKLGGIRTRFTGSEVGAIVEGKS